MHCFKKGYYFSCIKVNYFLRVGGKMQPKNEQKEGLLIKNSSSIKKQRFGLCKQQNIFVNVYIASWKKIAKSARLNMNKLVDF